MELSRRFAAAVLLFSTFQLLVIMISMNPHHTIYNWNYHDGLASHEIPHVERKAKQSTAIGDTTKKNIDNDTKADNDYPCFPTRQHNLELQTDGSSKNSNSQNHTIFTIYLETAHVNMHYEIYYSFINKICSCEMNKDRYWTIPTGKIPHFYVGPEYMLTVGFERVLREFNDTTSCGPIFFGEPTNPDLTIVTTAYPSNFDTSSGNKKQYQPLINDPRYIFICHEDTPFLEENATNVFFLTPLHKRYIIPSFFPPAIVQRLTSESAQQTKHKQHHKGKRLPIFLVLGSFRSNYRRNVGSLASAASYHRNKNFTLRFLGGASEPNIRNEMLEQGLREKFPHPEDYAKVELLPRTDTDEFMQRVAESDVILPLVDQQQFYRYNNGYQEGKKLTSSVMWGLGFHKKMILYQPLADVFGIKEDNMTYFLHGDSTAKLAAFNETFGRCLDHLL